MAVLRKPLEDPGPLGAMPPQLRTKKKPMHLSVVQTIEDLLPQPDLDAALANANAEATADMIGHLELVVADDEVLLEVQQNEQGPPLQNVNNELYAWLAAYDMPSDKLQSRITSHAKKKGLAKTAISEKHRDENHVHSEKENHPVFVQRHKLEGYIGRRPPTFWDLMEHSNLDSSRADRAASSKYEDPAEWAERINAAPHSYKRDQRCFAQLFDYKLSASQLKAARESYLSEPSNSNLRSSSSEKLQPVARSVASPARTSPTAAVNYRMFNPRRNDAANDQAWSDWQREAFMRSCKSSDYRQDDCYFSDDQMLTLLSSPVTKLWGSNRKMDEHDYAKHWGTLGAEDMSIFEARKAEVLLKRAEAKANQDVGLSKPKSPMVRVMNKIHRKRRAGLINGKQSLWCLDQVKKYFNWSGAVTPVRSTVELDLVGPVLPPGVPSWNEVYEKESRDILSKAYADQYLSGKTNWFSMDSWHNREEPLGPYDNSRSKAHEMVRNVRNVIEAQDAGEISMDTTTIINGDFVGIRVGDEYEEKVPTEFTYPDDDDYAASAINSAPNFNIDLTGDYELDGMILVPTTNYQKRAF